MAIPKKKVKADIINLRADPEQNGVIQKVADMLGVSTASFILEHSLKAARRELAAAQELRLSRHDAEIFLSALDHPPKPNEALKRAFQFHEKRFGK